MGLVVALAAVTVLLLAAIARMPERKRSHRAAAASKTPLKGEVALGAAELGAAQRLPELTIGQDAAWENKALVDKGQPRVDMDWRSDTERQDIHELPAETETPKTQDDVH